MLKFPYIRASLHPLSLHLSDAIDLGNATAKRGLIYDIDVISSTILDLATSWQCVSTPEVRLRILLQFLNIRLIIFLSGHAGDRRRLWDHFLASSAITANSFRFCKYILLLFGGQESGNDLPRLLLLLIIINKG